MIIDVHHHLWTYNDKDFPWISDDMAIIKQDFLDEAYQDNFKNIDKTIVVQAIQNESETQFLLEFAKRNEKVAGVIGWLDLKSDQLEHQLKKYMKDANLKGLRHVIHDEPDVDFMLDDAFVHGLKVLEKHDLIYELLIFPCHLDNTIKLVSQLPKLNFVIDHLAKPDIKNKSIESWSKKLKTLSDFDNVSIKLSGMVTEAHWNNWTNEEFYDYLDVALDTFGENRIMYGSDWPVCLLSASYMDVYNVVETWSNRLTKHQKDKLFFKNAISIYKL